MPGIRAPDPHSVKKRNECRRPASHRAEHLAPPIFHRLRTVEPARSEVFHQPKKERQVGGRHPLLIKRKDEIAAARVDEKIGIFDTFGNPLIRAEFAEIVAGKEMREILGRNVGIHRHQVTPATDSTRPLRRAGGVAYIYATFQSSLMTTGFARGGGRSAREILS